MAISLPLILLNSFSSIFSRFLSSNKILPDNLVCFFGNKPIIESEDTDFPEPDSPTIPRISFSKTSKEMECKTSILFSLFPKETERFSSDNKGAFFIISKIGYSGNIFLTVVCRIIFYFNNYCCSFMCF